MLEDAPDVNPRVANAIRLIDAARQYTRQLIADVDDADWFRIPAGCVSHVAWQAGHLAMAEYGLTMIRLRGKLPEDAAFIDNRFLRTFKKTSTPSADASLYPLPTDIRACLDAVHAQALCELPKYDDAQLDESLPEPFLGYPTKLGSLHFCHAHEMLHAGQIGMIRRMLGKEPLR